MNKNNTYEEILNIIAEAKNIAIAGHTSPDGDAIASVLALSMALNKLNKNVYAVLETYPEKYGFIEGKEFIVDKDIHDIDLFIALDCGDINRLGSAVSDFKNASKTLVIDHHISNDYYGDYNIVYPNVSSTSELIYNLIKEMDKFDRKIASALYAGIIFDTGGLRFQSTSDKTLIAVSELVKYDILFTQIYTEIMYSHTRSEALALATVIGKMKTAGNIIYSSLSIEEMEEINVLPTELDGIVEYMLNTKGAEVSIFAYEKSPNNVKVSMRSKHIDVNEIASINGGGGHKYASGCSFTGNIDEILLKMLSYF